MRAFEKVRETKIVVEKQSNVSVIKTKSLKTFSVIFLCLVTLTLLGVNLSSLGISSEVKNITSTWQVGLNIFNKKKSEEQVFMVVSSFELPFENCLANELDEGTFLINGNNQFIVKSCMKGKVKNIETIDGYRAVTIAHTNSIVSVYEYLDNATVKIGDDVEKNTPIGISLNSKVKLKVLYKNKHIAGLRIENGEFTFE